MIKDEKKTVGKMIYIYCAAKHGTSRTLCTKCQELNDYAQRQLSRCQFGDNKPTCEKCKIHCYNTEMRKRIQEVMKFSGPRMLFKSPILAIKHLIKNFRSR